MAHPKPRAGEGKYSPQLYNTYLHAERDDCLVRYLLARGFLAPHSNILDFGAGPGFLADAICRVLGEPDITCVESSESMAQHLSDKQYRVFHSLDAIDETLRFDVVIMKEVIEHVPNPINILYAIRRRMNQGAQIFISTPAGQHRTAHPNPQNLPAFNTPGHIQCFGERSLELALRSTGFRDFEFCYVDAFYPDHDESPTAVDERTRLAYKRFKEGRYPHLTFFGRA